MAETKSKSLNLYQKLVEIRKTVGKFNKDAKGYGYNYVSGSQVLASIKGKMDELGVVLETHLLATVLTPLTKGFVVSSVMKMIWVNAEKPEEKIIIDWFMAGEQKDPSQALGSALTYAERYFLLKSLGVPTDEDDPDKPKVEGDSKPEKKTGEPLEVVVGEVNYTMDDIVKIVEKTVAEARRKEALAKFIKLTESGKIKALKKMVDKIEFDEVDEALTDKGAVEGEVQ